MYWVVKPMLLAQKGSLVAKPRVFSSFFRSHFCWFYVLFFVIKKLQKESKESFGYKIIGIPFNERNADN